jgi:hypothetical protein
MASPADAQQGGNQAGLVVQFGDGSVYTACVDLGSDGEASGEELLRGAGLATVIDYNSGFGGGTVCKIDNQGCNFPGEACFCQCTMKPGDPCIYWTYFHQVDGQWRYSNLGVSISAIKTGDVQGWVWGPGSAGAGVQPPFITFEQICSDASQVAPAPVATNTAAPVATLTALPSFSPTVLPPTETPTATDTPTPSATPVPTQPALSKTPRPTAPTPSPTPSPRPKNTAMPSRTPSTTPTSEATATMTPSKTPQAVAVLATSEETASVKLRELSPTSLNTEGDSTGKTSNYVVFGVLAAVLLGGLVFMRGRERQ